MTESALRQHLEESGFNDDEIEDVLWQRADDARRNDIDEESNL